MRFAKHCKTIGTPKTILVNRFLSLDDSPSDVAGLVARGPPATAVPVLNLYCQRTKIQPAAEDGRYSTKVVLRERKSRRPPATAIQTLKLYYGGETA